MHFGATLLFFECNTLYARELLPAGIECEDQDILHRVGTQFNFQEFLARWVDKREYPGARKPPNYELFFRHGRWRRRRCAPQDNGIPPTVLFMLLSRHIKMPYTTPPYSATASPFETLRLNESTTLSVRDQLKPSSIPWQWE